MFCSNLFDGDAHEADEMPILLAGRGGGSLKTGRVLDYLRPGRRQPPRVQPVPVADGPDGRARSIDSAIRTSGWKVSGRRRTRRH